MSGREKEHLLQTERQTLKFRLLLLLAVAIGLYARKEGMPWAVTAGLLGGYLVYSVLLRLLIIPRFYFPYLIYAMISLDALAASLALWAFGIDSAVFIILPVFVIFYGIYLSYPGSLLMASLLSIAYASLAFTEKEAVGPAIALQVPFLYLIAILTGYLARERFKEREAKVALQEVIRAESQARHLLELARTLQGSLRLETLLQDLARRASELSGAPCSLLFLLDERQDRLVAKATNLPPELLQGRPLEQIEDPSGEDSVARRAWRKGQPLPVDSKDRLPWAQGLAYPPRLAVPLLAQGQPLGMLYLLAPEDSPLPEETEIQLAKGIADFASAAIANARLYAQAEKRAAETLSELQTTVQRMGRLREAQTKASLNLDNLSLDPIKGQAFLDGKPVPLSATEFQLLYFLAENAGSPINQETLKREVWGESHQGESNVVDVAIHRLRRKLEARPGGKGLIRTVRGSGYMLVRERR